MKKIIFFLSIILGSFVSGQESVKGTEELDELVLKKDSQEIYKRVEKAATFSKGTEVLQKMIGDNFRARKVVSSSQKETCELTFIIDRDGSLTDIKASGSNESFNQEAIRAISKIKDKWIPAEINGQKVRYRFRVPLTMSFDK
ncbi:energy transducer TonB [Chryseobacterium sp. ERMR1:04]|uniref:energy transducer TonB n=1 Tax=Chryseobacterium sp. ERMR1:04 TaxID=1705393 RepID=UPI0006C85E41|nr:energy transducer TonB [Chryseobacterium sp. ERMR1:04]